MNLKNKFVLLFSIGFSMGIIVSVIITSIITTNVINDGNTYFCNPEFSNMFGNELVAFIIQIIISGLLGAVCTGATVIYEIEEWSIFKATTTHFLISMSMLIITASILKWWNYNNMISNFIFIGIIVLMYVFIWLIQYVIYKIELNKIKKNIKKLHEKDTK